MKDRLVSVDHNINDSDPFDCIGKYNSDGDLVAIGHYKDGGFIASEVFIEE